MSMKQYSLKFAKLEKYAHMMVANNRSKISKFIPGVVTGIYKSFVFILCITIPKNFIFLYDFLT